MVELIRRVDEIRAALGRALAVADVVKVVCVAVVGINRCNGVRKFAASVVAVVDNVVVRECAARLST